MINSKRKLTPSSTAILIAIAIFCGAMSRASAQQDITGTIEIIRAGTVGNQLHVSDMIEIQNRSSLPATQGSKPAFDVYLPAQAKISSVLAAGPGNVAVAIPATPVPGDPGHYTVSFPLQPGATKFAFNYDLPYSGKAVFHLRHAYSLQQFAVMIPPTMKFSSASNAFKPLETGNNNYSVRAIAQLNPGPGPSFEISGSGTLPAIRSSATAGANANAHGAPAPPIQSPVAVNSAPRAVPARSPSHNLDPAPAQTPPPTTPSWMILGILGVGLAATSAAAIRVGATKRTATTKQMSTAGWPQPNQTRGPALLLEGLKEELFQLESAKVRGTISTEEYTLTKNALEETVKRAVRRAS
jgi:hypothetical protein